MKSRRILIVLTNFSDTLKFFNIFENFILFAQKIEQKLLQTPNYSFLFIYTLKSTFEMMNCMSMRLFETGNIFGPISVGGEQILLYRLLLFRIFDVFFTNFLSESTYKDAQSHEKLCF